MNAVPTLINIMTSLDSQCPLPPSVRLLNLGGEACPPALVNRLWSMSLRILNTYRPSETTVTATFQELFPNQQVTIWKPLPLYHALLLAVHEDGEKKNGRRSHFHTRKEPKENLPLAARVSGKAMCNVLSLQRKSSYLILYHPGMERGFTEREIWFA